MVLLAGVHRSSGRFHKRRTSPRVGGPVTSQGPFDVPGGLSRELIASALEALFHSLTGGSDPCGPLQMEPSLCSLHSPSPGWSQLVPAAPGCSLFPALAQAVPSAQNALPSSVHLPFEASTQGFPLQGGTLSNHGQSV